MNDNLLPVAPLHRVSLALRLAGPNGCSGGTEAAHPFSFILGVASGGMSPFEYALLNKVTGEEVELKITHENRHEIFEYLEPSLDILRGVILPVHLRARVTAVAPAASREIVQAMASVGGCECGCGCS